MLNEDVPLTRVPLVSTEGMDRWREQDAEFRARATADRHSLTDSEMRAWRQQVINDAAAAAYAYVDRKIGELRTFLLHDDEDNPGLLLALTAEMDRRTREQIAASIKQIPAGPVGPEGHLPPVKPYMPDTVHYKGDCVSHAGACYQAVRDTARPPSHADDWVCLAATGRDGADARWPRVCGTFSTSRNYEQFDIVVLNGSAFIARCDDPGICPSDNWQMICARGKPGEKGLKGDRGERGPQGEPGPSIIDWKLDPASYSATPILSGGRESRALYLRPFFQQSHDESGG
jgi:hypothetical protein